MKCVLCKENQACEMHHIIFRGQNKALIKCEKNLAPLCQKCHSEIHHGKGRDLDIKLKLNFQNYLEMTLHKEFFTEKEIKDILQISNNSVNILLKTLKRYKEGYAREDLIRRCMGGRIYES